MRSAVGNCTGRACKLAVWPIEASGTGRDVVAGCCGGGEGTAAGGGEGKTAVGGIGKAAGADDGNATGTNVGGASVC